MFKAIKIWYYRAKANHIIDKYEESNNENLNKEFQDVCKILQKIDPDAPSSDPPHISLMR